MNKTFALGGACGVQLRGSHEAPYRLQRTAEKERFKRLSTQSKHFVDTIKMIAYRAETAMAQTLREHMARHDDARSLLCALYSTEVDLLPNPEHTHRARACIRSPTKEPMPRSDTSAPRSTRPRPSSQAPICA